MHACNGQYLMYIPHLPNCVIENPGNSNIRDKYKTHENIHPGLNHYYMKDNGIQSLGSAAVGIR